MPGYNSEFNSIVVDLERFHGFFALFWSCGSVVWDKQLINPAQVVIFPKENRVIFKINPNQWKNLTYQQKLFIVCHEMYHLYLRHGHRIVTWLAAKPAELKKYFKLIANVSADLVVNESLINFFPFNRLEIDPNNEYIWLDKYSGLAPNKNLEYYLDKLSGYNLQSVNLVDDHDQLIDDGGFVNKILGQLSDSEQKILSRTTSDGQEFFQQSKPKVSKKIVNIFNKIWLSQQEDETWIKQSRRIAGFDSALCLPGQNEQEFKKEVPEIWFFQDTSGSCMELSEKFLSVARGIKSERFKIKFHCFDTKIYPIDLESGKLQGKGSTDFECIENYLKKQSTYPLLIIVITDGYGTSVTPTHPKRWYWLLSENYQRFIPKNSNILLLKNYDY